MCTNVCCHSSPKAWLCRLCRPMRTTNHLAIRSPYSSNHCGHSGLPLVYNWPSSRLWLSCPNQPKRLLDLQHLARIAHTTPTRNVIPLWWCICIGQECSTIWLFCLVSRTQFDGCLLKMQRSTRLFCDRWICALFCLVSNPKVSMCRPMNLTDKIDHRMIWLHRTQSDRDP